MNWLRILGIFLALCSSTIRADQQDCADLSERIFLDAVLNLDFDSANVAIDTFTPGNALIPSKAFYRALLDWVSATSENSNKAAQNALNKLASSVKNLELAFADNPSTNTELAWSLAAAHTARIQAVEEKFLGSFNLGYPAIKSLNELVGSGRLNTQQQIAAEFALGVYFLYLNNLPDGLNWAQIFLKIQGDLDQGIAMIRHAMTQSRYLAPEAARVLLLETPWRNSYVCDYLDIGQTLSTRYPNNPEFSIAYQGLLLRCGQPDLAEIENARLTKIAQKNGLAGFSPVNYEQTLELGRIRILAANGDMKKLQQYETKHRELVPYHDLAIANLMDINQQYDRSRILYNQVIENPDAPTSIKQSAKMRLIYPYSETIGEKSGQTLSIQQCLQ